MSYQDIVSIHENILIVYIQFMLKPVVLFGRHVLKTHLKYHVFAFQMF